MRYLVAMLVPAMAGYRLARLFAQDKLTIPLRRRLFRRVHREQHRRAMRSIQEHANEDPGPGPWEWAYMLATCPVCLGVWLSCAAAAVWWWAPDARPVVVLLAAAGVQAFLATRAEPPE